MTAAVKVTAIEEFQNSYQIGSKLTAVKPRKSVLVTVFKALGLLLGKLSWSRIRRPVLVLSSFSCFDFAAFQINTIAGWVVSGVSLLVLEYLTGDKN